MKRIGILLLAIALPCIMQAQRIHAYVTTGVTLSQIEGDELKGFRQIGNVSGVGALTALDDKYRWGLSIEALFSQRGAYNASDAPYVGRIALNYVDIPVMVHFQDPYGGMLFGLGLCYGRLVQQPHGKLEFNSNAYLPDTTDMTFLRNDLAAVLDFRFTIWKGLQFNLRWQYSILPVKKDWLFVEYIKQQAVKSVNDFYNNSIALRLIWQF